MASNATTQSGESAQRKRMRKGTRSCLECRTRKIRCIFPAGSRMCNGCKAHGKTCVEQTYNHIKEAGLDKRVGLKDRVKELEALVNQLMDKSAVDGKVEIPERYRKRLDERSGSTGGETLSPTDTASTPSGDSSLACSTQQSAAQLAQNAINGIYDAVDDLDDVSLGTNEDFAKSAVQSLFDNALLSHDRTEAPTKTQTSLNTPPLSRKYHARQHYYANELRALIPKPHDLNILLHAPNADGNSITVYEPIWKHAISPDMAVYYDGSMESVLTHLFESKSLLQLCKGLLYLALILQQLPADCIQLNLKFPDGLTGKELIQRYIDTVDEYLLSNDRIIGSLEGLECSAIMAQLLVNDGRPRKAWISFERCVSYAKLLGYNRPSSWKHDPNDPLFLGPRREKMWWSLYQGDRYLALLLGLPYCISDRHVDLRHICQNTPGQFISTDSFILKLAIIAGHMIDNAQTTDESQNTFGTAMRLDGELHAIACMVPDSWWNVFEPGANDSMDVYELYHRTKAIFWHNECRLMLHMPFMLRTLRKEENTNMYAYNRTVALNSARMMIKCHKHLRSRSEFAVMVCQVIDFQVFTAAMLLLLDMLERPDLSSEYREPQTIQDTELIIQVIGVLRRVSRESNGRCDIAGQAVKVLDGVAHVLYGCPAPNEKHPSRVVIPYFGAVTIKPVGLKKRCTCCPSVALSEMASDEPSPTSSDTRPTRKPIEDVAAEYGASVRGEKESSVPLPSVIPFPVDELISFDSFFGSGNGDVVMGQDWGVVSHAGGQQQQPLAGWTEPGVAAQDSAQSQDPALWDEQAWGNMLQPGLSMEMDGDWNWLLVE